jgi:hypothetical protein
MEMGENMENEAQGLSGRVRFEEDEEDGERDV